MQFIIWHKGETVGFFLGVMNSLGALKTNCGSGLIDDKVKKYTYEGSFMELLNWAVLVRAFSFNEVLQE